MELSELIALVGNFDALGGPEKLKLLAWHLHTHKGCARFDRPDIKKCFTDLHLTPPDLSVYFPRLIDQGVFLKDRQGVRLEGTARTALDRKYGDTPTTIAVSNALKELPTKIPDLAEQVLLKEAIKCYRAEAFRAAIVMTWSLAFDHLRNWIHNDATRLAKFNAAIVTRYPRKGLTITKIDDFEDLKDSEVIEVAGTAGLINGNIKKILSQKLDLRNIAAHPSPVVIGEPQANEYILTLVQNAVVTFV